MCVQNLPPLCWRYTTLEQCNVVNLHVLANCCVWNYTRSAYKPECKIFLDIGILTHFLFTLNIPPTWRRGNLCSVQWRNCIWCVLCSHISSLKSLVTDFKKSRSEIRWSIIFTGLIIRDSKSMNLWNIGGTSVLLNDENTKMRQKLLNERRRR